MSKFIHYQIDTKLVLLGFFVALFSAGIGIGGGTLLVSILMSLFGFDFKKAASTSLSTIIPISFIGSLSHFIFLSEIQNLRYYFMFILPCIFGTILGGRIVQKRQNRWLKISFSVFLLIISLRMLKIFDFPFLIFSELHGTLLSNEWLLIAPIGILIGIIAVFLGIGYGLLIVPFFVILVNFNMHEAITLSLTTMFFLSLSATIVNNKLEMLDIASFKSLFIPALTGAVVGAVISSQLPTPILKKLFGMFLLAIACNYIFVEFAFQQWLTVSIKKYMKGIKRAL